VALAVHFVTILIVVLGVVLAVATWLTPFYLVMAGLLVLLAWFLRPRFGRMPPGVRVPREAAPALFAMTDEIAATFEGPSFDVVVVTDEANAATSSVGLREKRVLSIGAPLWTVLTRDERSAVLAHELGHNVNGDIRRSLVVGTALRTLATWYQVFRPKYQTQLVPGVAIFQVVYRVLRYPLLTITKGLYRFELKLSLPLHQRAEYLADALSARYAGTEPLLSTLDKLLLVSSTSQVLRQIIFYQPKADLLAELRRRLETVPPRERDRLRRADRLQAESLYATHPPVFRRRDVLLTRRTEPGRSRVSSSDWDAVERELAPALAAVAKELRRREWAKLTPRDRERLGI
jgi:Zn-dependent protease with chaperone function